MNFKNFKNEVLENNKELQKEYDNLDLEFKIKQALIDLRKSNNLSQKGLCATTSHTKNNLFLKITNYA